MPTSNYIRIQIGDFSVQVEDPQQLPISIDYNLEDPEDFTQKPSATALALTIPATLMNDRAANTFRNAGIQDLTTGEVFRGNQKCIIESNGNELLTGKAFLTSATHTDRPEQYQFDLFGDNADWVLDLKESTIYDFVKHITLSFSRETIVASWAFDGTNEALPYVFAPVRYRNPMDKGLPNVVVVNALPIADFHLRAIYMKPSLSVYWILYWGLKSVGYQIKPGGFTDSEYFRRLVMPWTWGSFLTSEGTNLNIHKFAANSAGINYTWNHTNDYIDLQVTNDINNGMSDPNNDYFYNITEKRMEWTYSPNHDFGPLECFFHLNIAVDAKASITQFVGMEVRAWKVDTTGSLVEPQVKRLFTITNGVQVVESLIWDFKYICQPTEKVFVKVYLAMTESKSANSYCNSEVLEFSLLYFRIPLGGDVYFENYTGFKNYKWLDFVRGLIGLFNLSINTDPVNKVVVIEPTHAYYLSDEPTHTHPGYFNGDFVEWDGKEDLSKKWELQNFRDYEKELTLKLKDDSNDGILKTIQDRNICKVASAKYAFPDRFKAGKKEIENNFFSPLMHYNVAQWKTITGIAPQMPCMIPENISNTSASEAENTFAPKIAYYKGIVNNNGGFRFENETFITFPYMFSVNYQLGGQHDPILSFSDEKIKSPTGYVLGRGLLKRFYMNRLATMRQGIWYKTWFRLKNTDVANQLHREFKIYQGQKWELITITSYKPLQPGSTSCLLRKWAPISEVDFKNTFPSQTSVLEGITPGLMDLKYAQLLALITDIPTE